MVVCRRTAILDLLCALALKPDPALAQVLKKVVAAAPCCVSRSILNYETSDYKSY
jgi:hypothetical protein